MQRASKPVITVVTLLASWLLSAAFARADGANGAETPSSPTAGVVLISGGAAERHRAIVGRAIETAVRDAGWSLPSKPLTKSQADSMLACFDSKQPASCIPAPLRSARLFAVTVEEGQAENGAPMLVLTGRALVIDPPATAIRQQHCEHCANNDLTAASAELAKIVLRDLALSAGTTIVEFRSDPDGAEIVLDGRRIGATNGKFNTYPGKHLARFEKPGHIAQTREFTAKEDESVLVEAKLPKSDTGKPPIRLPSKLVPGVLFGVSGALLFTGGAGLYLATQNDSDDKRIHPRALPIGIGSTALGVGAAGVGLYLLWKGSRSSAPTVSMMPGGAVLGWVGTFR
jgi:PEGA domain